MKAVCGCTVLILSVATAAWGALAPSHRVTQGAIFRMGTQYFNHVTIFAFLHYMLDDGGAAACLSSRCGTVRR